MYICCVPTCSRFKSSFKINFLQTEQRVFKIKVVIVKANLYEMFFIYGTFESLLKYICIYSFY